MDPPDTRECPKCHKLKDFYPNQWQCKVCQKEYKRQWRKRNKELYNAKMQQYRGTGGPKPCSGNFLEGGVMQNCRAAANHQCKALGCSRFTGTYPDKVKLKRCSRCKKKRPLDQFGIRTGYFTELNSYCKKCQSCYTADWTNVPARRRKRNAKRRAEYRANEIANDREPRPEPCMDDTCGRFRVHDCDPCPQGRFTGLYAPSAWWLPQKEKT